MKSLSETFWVYAFDGPQWSSMASDADSIVFKYLQKASQMALGQKVLFNIFKYQVGKVDHRPFRLNAS